MRCIFCKVSTDQDTSVEHIIPESLGNKEHVLPRGWVCDNCNNYFSRKIEAKFLNSSYGKLSRFEMGVESKKGRIPSANGFLLGTRFEIEFTKDLRNGALMYTAANPSELDDLIKIIEKKRRGSFVIPHSGLPKQSTELSRFIGKIALEVLAHRCLEVKGWNQEIVGKEELDELRTYVRYGHKGLVWPIHIERIYEQDRQFEREGEPDFQTLHEFDLLFIPNKVDKEIGEFYVVVAIFGVQYTINLGGPEIEGYLEWLDNNNGQSYLYLQ